MLEAIMVPGSPLIGRINPPPLVPFFTGPPRRVKSRSEWQPSQASKEVYRYCPRSTFSFDRSTRISGGLSLEGPRSSKYKKAPMMNTGITRMNRRRNLLVLRLMPTELQCTRNFGERARPVRVQPFRLRQPGGEQLRRNNIGNRREYLPQRPLDHQRARP